MTSSCHHQRLAIWEDIIDATDRRVPDGSEDITHCSLSHDTQSPRETFTLTIICTTVKPWTRVTLRLKTYFPPESNAVAKPVQGVPTVISFSAIYGNSLLIRLITLWSAEIEFSEQNEKMPVMRMGREWVVEDRKAEQSRSNGNVFL